MRIVSAVWVEEVLEGDTTGKGWWRVTAQDENGKLYVSNGDHWAEIPLPSFDQRRNLQ